ncbi:MAG: type VI secretion system contractile sheath large subunit [Pirellulales bacterium]|jgi:type VI secretion system protein ImpC|nr:type VI secretion system contractile sheath large subunit [Thermoguttaceae bacterium]MDD4787888.1 type VI secretion system contractile sheath large subunit [Pirellulales bacterium]MDI9443456.1 type VI secretion system contractile sheath large subunit [Planctomycetota bacterium]NLZ01333.1 type VI secretion system contractile sheath large subunit [Pirellulaceae bacterium]
MSTDSQSQGQARPSPAEAAEASILDQAIKATKATEASRAQDLLRTLTEEALKGTITWNKDVTRTITAGVSAIDAAISRQLALIMHNPKFQQLEGSWRGLEHLVMNSETSAQLRIKVLNLAKRELFKDLDRAVEFDQSQAFKKLYENEFGTPGGEPYGALIGDYEFTNHPEDIELLGKMSNVAAAAFCPFISAAAPGLFGFDRFTELSKPRDLERIFDTVEYTKWTSFRDSEDSRFVVLTMPRVLSRLPYGSQTRPVEEFDFEEVELDANGQAKAVSHDQYCWMNSAYVMGTRLTDAFAKYGFCTAIRGAEGGGKVEGLPTHIFTSDDGDLDLKCPTEIAITDRREAELSKLGFLPLCHYKNTDYSVFFGAQSAQRPKKYDRPEATANAAISARLPYIMASSRFAHYLKVIARDKIGSFMEVGDCQAWLERWITNYVSADSKPSAEAKARYPLREAKIEVREVPGAPGSYSAVAWLRPWLQMEELTTSLRLVARIPQLSK